jgi:LDH2 family malate/lactate/ureidoglycolate dehydrogenase
MAGHKGYGLALLIESLSGLLTGAAFTRQILRWMIDDPTQPTGHGAAFIALDVAAFMPLAAFFQRVDALIDEIHRAPRAPGAERIYLPGEMEWERRDHALTEGIRFPDDVLESLRGLAEEFSLDFERLCP